ncbi:MAG: glycosyltransferase family 4 protein [Chloroflexi bacterium]|nr:glycosyltransferase family 4 protein [Chloroflexota bacterium]MCI0580235.1 glycosyltransferase family 4 protein [Chloroflexota bacterium]MCI0646904.1 glycosyltransferase family 4 protein [Chloroflexota bacterium]MCI0729091.1 glycosyltransferase family 4 protein [Chloroflexota bacterium]
MRIALLVPGFSRDADDWAIPALQNLAGALAHEHDVHVFSLRYPAAGHYTFGGLIHHATGGGQRFGLASVGIWWRTLQAIIRQHRQAAFDVLHAFWADEPGLTAVLAGAVLRRPALISLGGGELTYLADVGYGTQGSRLRRRLIRFALRQATLVTAGSCYQLGLARRQGAPADRLRLAPLGVNTELFRPGPLLPWQQPTLIQAAALTPVKNQALLLETLALVREQMPQARLVVAGGGSLDNSLAQLAQRLRLSDNITWQQAVHHLAMTPIYQQAHLYMQSSRHESQGVAVLEALACGLPAIGTPVGLLPEVACLPPAWTAGALAGQIIQLFSDEAAYLELRQQARQMAENRYSLPTTTAAFVGFYQEVG